MRSLYLTISLLIISAPVYASQPVSVPEPGVFGLMVAGLIGVAIARKRHRDKKDDD